MSYENTGEKDPHFLRVRRNFTMLPKAFNKLSEASSKTGLSMSRYLELLILKQDERT